MSSISQPTGGHGHGVPARHNTRLSNGLIGVIFFLCTEVALFGSLFCAYVSLRRGADPGPPHGISRLEVALPAINTIVLIISGVWCHYADTAISKGNVRRFMLLLALTILFGAAFLGGQAWEYKHLSIAVNHDTFGATFFILTGLHGAHVTMGVLALLWVFILGLHGRWSANHHFAVRGVTLYWHFVDVVWVLLFALFYLT